MIAVPFERQSTSIHRKVTGVVFTSGARCRKISPMVAKPRFTIGARRAESVDHIAAVAASFFAVLVLLAAAAPAQANPAFWRFEWPNTDFSKFSVDLSDIISGGPACRKVGLVRASPDNASYPGGNRCTTCVLGAASVRR